MADVVLLVFEGEKTELQIASSLNQHYFPSKPLITSFNAEIYQLWRILKDDDDLDLLEIIKERSPKNQVELANVQRKDVAQIFLFFDYDGHATNASDETIRAMLAHFDNETGNGKLYISYPMVEAIKHLQLGVDFSNVVVNATETTGAIYKPLVAQLTRYPDFKKLTKSDWRHIIAANLAKANFVVNDTPKIPAYREIASLNQSDIFKQQQQKYILPKQLLAVLSAFPFFIIEYFGEKAYAELEQTINPA